MNQALPRQQASTISPAESARYTRDMLGQLKAIAEEQGQTVLAHLLALASLEAGALAKLG
ncbi:MAG TPA: hypothetical protein VGM36_04785 [Rhizomicrobium sp.]